MGAAVAREAPSAPSDDAAARSELDSTESGSESEGVPVADGALTLLLAGAGGGETVPDADDDGLWLSIEALIVGAPVLASDCMSCGRALTTPTRVIRDNRMIAASIVPAEP